MLLLPLLLLWRRSLGSATAGQSHLERNGGDSLAGGGSGLPAVEVNLLDILASHNTDLGNFSHGYDDANCSILEVGQYATLSIPSVEAFGENFADELSLLLMLRYSLKENTSLLTIIGLRSNILFQIRITPHTLVFVARRGHHYEFPVSSLADGHWHRVALSISLKRLALYVDCYLLESVGWSGYFGMGVATEGLVVIGGLIEPFEVPFEGALRQLSFWMGDAGVAERSCQASYSTCGSLLDKEVHHGSSHFQEKFPQAWTQGSELAGSDVALKSPMAEQKDLQKNPSTFPSRSPTASDMASKRPKEDGEEEGILTFREEPPSATYKKMTRSRMLGSEKKGNTDGSIASSNSWPSFELQDLHAIGDNGIPFQSPSKESQLGIKKVGITRALDKNTKGKSKGDIGSWEQFSTTIIDLDSPLTPLKIPEDGNELPENKPRVFLPNSSVKGAIFVDKGVVLHPSRVSAAPSGATKSLKTPSSIVKGHAHRQRILTLLKGVSTQNFGPTHSWQLIEQQKILLKPGPRGLPGLPGLPVSSRCRLGSM
ncbi:collagen alpha-2(XI) chain-like [Zootoca vivipara]|uniref:collagen alpha-2(XI) chain-like n=1 Tax=Zootoca vivipara TaxID=8524 RepID=UPI00293C0138|nr:collagen alpha-2(XI) chain-like [Zootoca vivipara]